jgi:hypothetical protein
MHKNAEVAIIELDSRSGIIHKIIETIRAEHLPVGTAINFGKDAGKPRIDWLNDWWSERCIPAGRAGIKAALEEMGLGSTMLLLERCMGLSLSDHYWIRKEGSDQSWEDLNFFTHEFSQDVGDALFGHKLCNLKNANLISPDNTTAGVRIKRWIIAGGKRFLLKGSEGVYKQEPHNEAIASEIMKRLGVSHAEYSVAFENGKPYSVCENFVAPQTELVAAYRVMESQRQRNGDNRLAHLLHCCELLGIPDVLIELCKMLTVDFIIANEDRHNTNYGFIRDAETLEWRGLAPIYDCGASLWYNSHEVRPEVCCMPFRKTHDDQIKLVKDFSWFNSGGLTDADELVMGILSSCDTVDENRRVAIAKAVKDRVHIIEQLAIGKSLYQIKGRSFRPR